MWALSWLTCFMRSLRTVTACAGGSESWARGEWVARAGQLGAAGGAGRAATYQQCRVFFALEVHGGGWCAENGRAAAGQRFRAFT